MIVARPLLFTALLLTLLIATAAGNTGVVLLFALRMTLRTASSAYYRVMICREKQRATNQQECGEKQLENNDPFHGSSSKSE